ncbi:unnamed protein product [Dovyalis caffra]|uniref:Uncharacterized protein n=1 Tax=Dovyalis caffra TaxID=77055 RepID=A0AAV1RAR6_9ROSI|nr:unnamed protein product [Dovyalis caffra]
MASDNNLETHAILTKATMKAKIVTDLKCLANKAFAILATFASFAINVENVDMAFIKTNAITKIIEGLDLSSNDIKDLIAILE